MSVFDYVFLWFTIVWSFGMCVIMVIATNKELKSRKRFLEEFSKKVEGLKR